MTSTQQAFYDGFMGEDGAEVGIQPIFAELPDESKNAEKLRPKVDQLIVEFKKTPPIKMAEKMDISGRLSHLVQNPETYVMLQKGLGIAFFAGAIAGVYSHDIPAQFIIKAPDIINASMGYSMENALFSSQAEGIIDILENLGVPVVGDFTKAMKSLADSHPKLEAFLVGTRDRVKEELIDFGFKRQKIGAAMQVFGVQPPALMGAVNG